MDERRLAIKKRLQEFQVERLKGTYRDFLEHPVFRPMCVFFTDHLYSSADQQARNESFFKLVHAFERVLGKEILQSVSQLVELHDLSETLDNDIVEQFVTMGVGLGFDMASYEQAYFEANRYEERVRQIELIEKAVLTVHRITFFPFIGLLLKTLHAGAVVIGATAMVDFLQDGYRAFRAVPDATPFTGAIRQRELERLDRIYGVKR